MNTKIIGIKIWKESFLVLNKTISNRWRSHFSGKKWGSASHIWWTWRKGIATEKTYTIFLNFRKLNRSFNKGFSHTGIGSWTLRFHNLLHLIVVKSNSSCYLSSRTIQSCPFILSLFVIKSSHLRRRYRNCSGIVEKFGLVFFQGPILNRALPSIGFGEAATWFHRGLHCVVEPHSGRMFSQKICLVEGRDDDIVKLWGFSMSDGEWWWIPEFCRELWFPDNLFIYLISVRPRRHVIIFHLYSACGCNT